MGIVHKDGFKLSLVSYFGLGLGYVNRVLLFPNYLSTEQIGLANILLSVALIYAQFSALGLWGIILRFFPFFRNKEKQHHGFLFWASILMTVGFVFTTLVFLLFKPLVVSYFSAQAKLLVDYYYYIIPLGLATMFFMVYDSYLRSMLKTVVPSFINEVVLRLMVMVSIGLYAFKLIDFHLFVIIFVGVNCSVAIFVIGYTAFLGHLFLKPSLSPTIRRLSRHMLWFGLISILSTAGNALITNIDTLMIAALMGGEIVQGVKVGALHYVGIYTTVFFFTSVILIPYRSILKITSPLVAQHWKERNMQAMEALYKQVTSVLMVLGILFFMGVWVNFDNIVSFMPKDFASGKYVFLFVCLGRLFDMTTGLNGVITVTSKKYRYDLIFTGLLIVMTIGLNYLFIRTYDLGINGAAIATMTTLVVYNVLRLFFVRYFFNMQPFTRSNIWVLGIGIACFCLNYFIPFMWNRYIDILFRSSITACLFLGPIVLFKLVPDVNVFVVKFLASLGIRLKFLE
jgi:O-antigen/teichoic acid export membrane protein